LTLADLYFEKPDYFCSQAYYDTALQALPKDHPTYEALQKKSQVLTELVSNLTVVQTEDSLQRLAQIPENERLKIIDGIIAKYAEEEKKNKKKKCFARATLPCWGKAIFSARWTLRAPGIFYNPFGYKPRFY
jgi:hypothetical protein